MPSRSPHPCHRRRAGSHPITHRNQDLGIGREENIDAGSESDQADAIAAANGGARLVIEHDPAGHEPGNLLQGDGVRVRSGIMPIRSRTAAFAAVYVHKQDRTVR